MDNDIKSQDDGMWSVTISFRVNTKKREIKSNEKAVTKEILNMISGKRSFPSIVDINVTQ